MLVAVIKEGQETGDILSSASNGARLNKRLSIAK